MNPVPDRLLETTATAFIVGDLTVDVGQQRVTRAGIDIALPNLSFRLLVALVRAAPNVLGNDSLMTRVWPGLVVSPETVSKRVNLLRDALGDDPREPRYIAGVRSRGYRLIAPVSLADDAALRPPVPTTLPDVITQIVDVPVLLEPIEAPHTESLKSRSQLILWATLSVVAIALVVSAAIGIRWAGRQHPDVAMPVSLAPAATIGEQSRTVAVLPFESISADPADAYLAQGLPEMILNRLSRVSGLSVIARNSSFALATKSIDSREIGRRLNSGYLIGGSVQREADRLRVAVQLVDSAAGTLIWSAHFDRGLHDIFSIEDEIADQIAGALSVRLGEPEANPPAGARSANLEAYLAFLRGRTLLGRFTVAESEAAVPYFEKAIALDPRFASAYASLYDARMQAADQRRENLTLARERYGHLIDRALELDPKSGAAYFARAMWGDQPYDASAISTNPLIVARERDFRQGAALDPSNGRGLGAYAEFLYSMLQRHEEGRTVLKRALWVDPMSPHARFTDAEFSLDDSGVKVSEEKTLQVLELDPNFVPALQRYGTFRWLFDGKLAEAIQILEHAIALDPSNPSLRYAAVEVYLDLGELKAAREVAAGTPQSAPMSGLLSMYEGDWRRAGLSAYDEAGWTSDDDLCKHMLASNAIRDYALQTEELSRAIAFIKLKYYLGDSPAADLEVCNYQAAVYLSQLMAAAGQSEQALTLRRAASAWLDTNEIRFFGDARGLRAAALLLDGKQDAALSELAESFRSGRYVNWWYTLKFDPLWVPLHKDPRFQAIEADVQKYIDVQRTELEALRKNGLVPRRGRPAAWH
jgi:TolB-like protein/DNA-binding winged helix-turn-helix (wHTH) protein